MPGGPDEGARWLYERMRDPNHLRLVDSGKPEPPFDPEAEFREDQRQNVEAIITALRVRLGAPAPMVDGVEIQDGDEIEVWVDERLVRPFLYAAPRAGYVIVPARTDFQSPLRWGMERAEVLTGAVRVRVTRCGQAPVPQRGAANLLTPAECEVVRWMALGMHYKQIAHERGVCVGTIKRQSGAIFKKLGVHDKAGAVVEALRQGWVTLGGASNRGKGHEFSGTG